MEPFRRVMDSPKERLNHALHASSETNNPTLSPYDYTSISCYLFLVSPLCHSIMIVFHL